MQWNVTFLTVFGTLALVVAATTVVWGRKIKNSNHAGDREDSIRFYSASLQTLGIVLWPLVFNAVIGLKQIATQPAYMFGLLWPMVILLAQLKADRVDLNHQNQPIVPSAYKDTGMILSVVLPMSGLLISAWPDEQKKNRQNVTRILMFAIMMSIAFILPLGNLSGDDHEPSDAATLVQTSQRVFLNYSIGFIILALTAFLGGGQ